MSETHIIIDSLIIYHYDVHTNYHYNVHTLNQPILDNNQYENYPEVYTIGRLRGKYYSHKDDTFYRICIGSNKIFIDNIHPDIFDTSIIDDFKLKITDKTQLFPIHIADNAEIQLYNYNVYYEPEYKKHIDDELLISDNHLTYLLKTCTEDKNVIMTLPNNPNNIKRLFKHFIEKHMNIICEYEITKYN